MPCTPETIELFKKNKLLFAPGKASNAGGVAVSGLEMAQNSLRYSAAFTIKIRCTTVTVAKINSVQIPRVST